MWSAFLSGEYLIPSRHRVTGLPISLPLLLIGAGGHAKVVIELFRAAHAYEPVGLVVREPSTGSVLGVPIVGTDSDLSRLRKTGLSRAFVAIGDNERRLATGRGLERLGFEIVNAISPMAAVSPSACLGRGIAIMAGVSINADAQIDDFAVINTGASIDHDCHVGEGSHVAPGCAIAGNVMIGRLALIGIGSSAIPGISIGDGATIGAGACVVRNVPSGAIARGVPARVVRRHSSQ